MRDVRLSGWVVAVLLSLVLAAAQSLAGEKNQADAAEMNRRLGRGINMGNMLEAPREGAWGVVLDEAYFQLVKEAGFDSVRIPIRWSAHAAQRSPYQIDAEFFRRVDRAVEAALAQELITVINVHHFDALYENPREQTPRFLALWRQIASRYQQQPPELLFELLNEPQGQLNAQLWNQLLAQGCDVVRQTNPDRIVIIGPAPWNDLAGLEELELPSDDDRLIATFHYYQPFQFTHQGASWTEGSQKWLGTTWTGTVEQREAILADLDRAVAWAERHRRPLYLGEFGAYSKADMMSRAKWTEFVGRAAEERGISWAYWELASGFGAYDPVRRAWRQPLLEALIPPRSR